MGSEVRSRQALAGVGGERGDGRRCEPETGPHVVVATVLDLRQPEHLAPALRQ